MGAAAVAVLLLPAAHPAADLIGTVSVTASPAQMLEVTHSDEAGAVTVAPGQARHVTLTGATPADVDVLVQLTVPRVPATGTGVYVGPTLHSFEGGSRSSQAEVVVRPDGAAAVRLVHYDAGVATRLTPNVPLPFGVAAGDPFLVRVRSTGAPTRVLGAKVWQPSHAEPTEWLATARLDAPDGAGRAGLRVYASAAGTAATVRVEGPLVTSEPEPIAEGPAALPPDATVTGAPDDSGRRAVYPPNGRLVLSTPGARLDRVDVHGFVEVRAPNVRITRSTIAGPDTPVALDANTALLTSTTGASDLVVEDTTIRPTHAQVRINGVHGWGFTLRRVDISGTVDGVVVFGNEVSVADSWIHDLAEFEVDPNQANGPSHNDGVQVQGGARIRITGNTITGARNAALMVTQDHSPTTDTWFTRNWVDGGWCSVNISKKDHPYMTGLRVEGNAFGRDTARRDCAIIFNDAHSDLIPRGNIWWDTGEPTQPRRGG